MTDSLNRLEAALMSAVAETMENMAFEQVETISGDGEAQLGINRIWSALNIIRPVAGEITIELSADYSSTLTDSLYGSLEGNLNDEVISDALAEILNTVAGRFMTQLIPPAQKFELGLPRVGRGTRSAESSRQASLTFDIGGQYIRAGVWGDDFYVYKNTVTTVKEGVT